MGLTYESICIKLGFDPLNYKPKVSDFEDDSRNSPFSILSVEESLFLNDYLMKNKRRYYNEFFKNCKM